MSHTALEPSTRKKAKQESDREDSAVDALNVPNMRAIVAELNLRAERHVIGELQAIRTALKGLSRAPAKGIFSEHTTKEHWSFHNGGRTELQFNVGLEAESGYGDLRFGVAFSFEASRTLPTPVETLATKVRLFNDFMELNGQLFADLRMWHFEDNKRSPDYMPGSIPWERVNKGVFVFLGSRQPVGALDYEMILNVFDRLLPIYKYVESGGASPPISMPSQTAFVFRPGCSVKASSTTATQVQKQLDVSLRHNELQEALHQRLVSEYGKDNVAAENASSVGTRIDVVVRKNGEYWFYEIKTALSPRACLREAMGQLLEYAFWPGAQVATRLVVVGESALDNEGSEYLRCLQARFSLPISYEQIRP